MSNRFYVFGEFELDSQSCLLRHGSYARLLRPNACEFLSLLLDRAVDAPDDPARRPVVRYEEFISPWPELGGAARVHTEVAQLRKALGNADLIETVPKTGYRWVGPRPTVARSPPAAVPDSAGNRADGVFDQGPSEPTGHRKPRGSTARPVRRRARAYSWRVGAIVVVLAIALGLGLTSRRQPIAIVDSRPVVFVAGPGPGDPELARDLHAAVSSVIGALKVSRGDLDDGMECQTLLRFVPQFPDELFASETARRVAYPLPQIETIQLLKNMLDATPLPTLQPVDSGTSSPSQASDEQRRERSSGRRRDEASLVVHVATAGAATTEGMHSLVIRISDDSEDLSTHVTPPVPSRQRTIEVARDLILHELYPAVWAVDEFNRTVLIARQGTECYPLLEKTILPTDRRRYGTAQRRADDLIHRNVGGVSRQLGWHLRGRLALRAIREPREAVAAFDNARYEAEVTGQFPGEPVYGMGLAYYALRDWTAALRSFERAERLERGGHVIDGSSLMAAAVTHVRLWKESVEADPQRGQEHLEQADGLIRSIQPIRGQRKPANMKRMERSQIAFLLAQAVEETDEPRWRALLADAIAEADDMAVEWGESWPLAEWSIGVRRLLGPERLRRLGVSEDGPVEAERYPHYAPLLIERAHLSLSQGRPDEARRFAMLAAGAICRRIVAVRHAGEQNYGWDPPSPWPGQCSDATDQLARAKCAPRPSCELCEPFDEHSIQPVSTAPGQDPQGDEIALYVLRARLASCADRREAAREEMTRASLAASHYERYLPYPCTERSDDECLALLTCR